MKKLFGKFLRRDEGAVTVDWVVLTAAVVGLAVGVMLSFDNGTTNVASGVGGALTNATVDPPSFDN